jgi:hypothetical protein
MPKIVKNANNDHGVYDNLEPCCLELRYAFHRKSQISKKSRKSQLSFLRKTQIFFTEKIAYPISSQSKDLILLTFNFRHERKSKYRVQTELA